MVASPGPVLVDAECGAVADLSKLNYEPLMLRPAREALDAYRVAREIPGYEGYDEQKAAPAKKGVFGRPGKAGMWDRRYRLSAFAEANGMTYVFAADPARWPGKVPGYSRLYSVLQTTTDVGQRVMACSEIFTTLGATRSVRGRPTRERNQRYYQTVAVELGAVAASPNVLLRRRRRPDRDGTDLLRANYRVDDFLPPSQDSIDSAFDTAGRYLGPETLQTILDTAPDYDLQLAGAWLYLMKPIMSANKDADPDLIRERFTVAAQVGPLAAVR